MDLQERKIHFVQEFLRLNDESIINKLESTLKSEKKKVLSGKLIPFTMEEFNEMIEGAVDDVKNGRVNTTAELREEMKSW